MDIMVNAEVYCTDGFYGHSICSILNPTTEKVTHVVVEQEGLFPHTWLVPMSHVVDSASDRIQLDLSKKKIEKELAPFIIAESLDPDSPDSTHTTGQMWSRLITNLEMNTLKHENIPLHELAVHSGALVEAKDGVIGHLENFIVNPDDKHVTQIVIRTRHWFAHSRLIIPVSVIERFEEDAIYLSLSKRGIKGLVSA